MASELLATRLNHSLHMSLAFPDFYTRTTEYDALTKWFEDNVAHKNNIKSMLCVGSGLGFDLTLASKVESLTHVTMIDNNAAQLKAAVHTKSRENLTVEVKCLWFEEFIPSMQYDLVLFSHVLYYIPDRIAALNKAIAMLSDNGFILIFHQTEKGINELQKLFNSTKHSYCFSDLKKDLEAANIVHSTDIVDSTVRIDTPTKELCDFFLEKNSSDDECVRLSAHLNSLGTLLYHPCAIITIHRSWNKGIISLDDRRHQIIRSAAQG
ncbi:unnamed protein product [Rotaria socialis]|uniref:Methyltransferase type 12 domain-containing protein n=1 Tax=Rotaria socialis TaxID=392032 RepID=A0A821GSI3_9BILA|nr:unnamed protein product [Rotaria socialis]CAF4671126.1 unnamed protein product [Rotaria socialis]